MITRFKAFPLYAEAHAARVAGKISRLEYTRHRSYMRRWLRLGSGLLRYVMFSGFHINQFQEEQLCIIRSTP